jgi:drug/metabolite transporter (DMT)-like permease
VLLYLVTGEPLPAVVPARAAASIIYLGVVGSVLGFALYYHVLRHVEATRVALITLVTPVIALLLGKLLNNEPLQMEVWVGTAFILSGLLVFEYGQQAIERLRPAAARLLRAS